MGGSKMSKGLTGFSVLILLGACLAFPSASPAQIQGGQAKPTVIHNMKHDVSPPLRHLPPSVQAGSAADQQQLVARPTRGALANSQADPVAQPLTAGLSGVSTGLNFDGQSAQDNRNLFGFAFVPPDTNGAVGATQFVQTVNVTIAVYDKRTGALQLGPEAIHTLWAGFGGLCEFGGGTPTFADGGDPIVLYDHLAGRWLVTQLQYNTTFTQTAQCLAVSTSSDATGSYNRYEYDFGSNFPDYPKFGIWPDAYYNTINVFPPKKFAGAQACAFDRNAMLAGASASAICFQNPPSVSSLLPSDLDGSTLPPAGQPNFFVDIADSSDLNIFQFHVDFANPANSRFTGPVLIPVAPF